MAQRKPHLARQAETKRWLLFVHQLPSTPSNLRVKTWRRLQQLGAIAIKQAVYVLPDSQGAREDFEWLKTEIESDGGEASVFVADTVDVWSDDELIEAFRRSRQEAYAALADDAEALLRPANWKGAARAARAMRASDGLRQRLAALARLSVG